MNQKKVGGFEPIPNNEVRCYHPNHDPPTHLVIPQGQQYRHICPGCKREVVMRAPQVRLISWGRF